MPIDRLKLIADFHKDAPRQGPGADDQTERALSYVGSLGADARIIDIGCGTGAQTMTLARSTAGQITAIDRLPAFLGRLAEKVSTHGLGNRVRPVCASMFHLPCADGTFDLIGGKARSTSSVLRRASGSGGGSSSRADTSP